MGRKHCGKRRNCSLRAISSFPRVFQKACFPGTSKGVIVWEWVKRLVWQTCKNKGLFGNWLSHLTSKASKYPILISPTIGRESADLANFMTICHKIFHKWQNMFLKEKTLVTSIFLCFQKCFQKAIFLNIIKTLDCVVKYYPIPTNLDLTKLKAFADHKLNVTKMIVSAFHRVENIVGKGEIACTGNFPFSHNVFKRLLSQTRQKVLLWGNGLTPY